MADSQFNPLGTVTAPADWTLPASLNLQLKNVYASFDGTSAAGSFVPCLQIISDSGHTVGSYPSATTVAAGASADTTWFPGLRTPCPQWPNSNQSTEVLSFGPWAYWKLNEANAAPTAVDSSGHGRNLTIRDADVTGGRSGIVPTSSDTSSFVIWNSATNVAPWLSPVSQTWTPAVGSWEYWINSPGHSPNVMVLGILGTISSAASKSFWMYLTATGAPVFEYQDTGGTTHTLTFNAGVVDNSTHQLVYVLDGQFVTVYVDGAQADQQAQPATMTNPFTAVPSLGMSLGGAGSRYYTGLIEHVAWYDKVLTAANVAALYKAGTVI